MMRRLIEHRLAAFESRWGYPMDYARALLRASRRGFWRFSRVMPLAAWRDGVPAAAWHCAKIAAVRAEDCGPCTQLAVDMARAEGVADALLQAVLAGDEASVARLDPDAATTLRFTLAWLQAAPTLAERREELLRRFGERGLASLALAISAARLFPMIKSALGHAQQCRRVRVGDHDGVPVPIAVRPPA